MVIGHTEKESFCASDIPAVLEYTKDIYALEDKQIAILTPEYIKVFDFEGNPVMMKGSDRNDLCVAPRVLPVVEAMAAMAVMDFWVM